MCGICGFYAERAERLSETLLRRMCSRMVYRGPDDEGIYVDGRAGLGMRRLSIIDLEGGTQPIFNEDRSICVVQNGEIYNFPALRKELTSRGHQLRTRSDTEVIVVTSQ